MKITKNIFLNIFILIIILSTFLSSSRLIIRANFPIINDTHETFYNHYKTITQAQQIRIQNNLSEDLCKKIENQEIDRHTLRWVFESFRLKIFDHANLYGKKNLEISYNFIIFLLISLSFLFVLLSINQQNPKFLKKKENFFSVYLLFIFILSFFSIRIVAETRFSFFELFFISGALYFALKKNRYLFFIFALGCTLNRESGILISSIWFFINGIDYVEKKILIRLKEFLFSFVVTFATLILLVIFNWEIFSCGLKMELFLIKDVSDKYAQTNYLTFGFINSLFSNYIIIIFFLYIFFVSFEKQYKMLLVIILYYLVFLVFTPIQHEILRIVTSPFLIIYFYQYLDIKRTINN